jgi:uncharacterized phage-associated protein
MSHQATSVANTFLDLAQAEGRELTNMKVQKLVFIAHGIYMGLNGEDRPLIKEHVKAWKWGPVIEELYEGLKEYGAFTCGKVKDENGEEIAGIPEDAKEYDFVKTIWKLYKDFTAFALSRLTHMKDTPWDIVWRAAPWGYIPNGIIATYYERAIKEANQPK